MTLIAETLEAFFCERLIEQRNSSPQTIAAYRDTLRLLLRFAQQHTGKPPYRLDFDDLDAQLIGAFLTHLETDRGNGPRTRNARLGAIHSLYRFAALRHPEHAATIARVMAIPTKRYQRNVVSYLDLDEITALLAAPDRTTWLGRRDYALLVTAIKTGLRVSELTALRISDVTLGRGVFGEELADCVPGRWLSLTGREQRFVGLALAFFDPGAEDRDGLAGQRRDPLLPSLADHLDARAAAEGDIADAQGGEL